MQDRRKWTYHDLQVEEGLKPTGEHFQYFFLVSEGGEKKCNYCVWIDDDALSRFARSRAFEEIASSQREDWSQWVQRKIDQGDFRDLVLKLEKTGQKEVNLREMEEKLTFE